MMRAQIETVRLDPHIGFRRWLYDSMDPAPVRLGDPDPAGAAHIVDRTEATLAGVSLGLRAKLEDEPTDATDAANLRYAVHEYLSRRELVGRRQLGQCLSIVNLQFSGSRRRRA